MGAARRLPDVGGLCRDGTGDRHDHPSLSEQITNLDVLRQQIRNYYGDPLGSGAVGHDSYYARRRRVAAAGRRWLTRSRDPMQRDRPSC